MKKRLINKRRLIVFGIVGLLTVSGMVGYGLLSMRAYDDLANQAQARAQGVIEARNNIFADIEDSKQARAERKERIESAIELTSGQPGCSPGGIYNWQSNLGYVEEEVNQCQKALESISSVRSALLPLKEFLDQENRLLETMKTITTDTDDKKVGESQLDDSLDEASRVRDDVAALEVPDVYRPVQQTALKQVGLIEKEWQSLVSANKKQDSKSFLDAVDRLSSAYAALEKISIESDKKLADLLETLMPEDNKSST